VIGDCRAKVRPDPPPPAIGSEGVAVCSGALSFASYDAMLDHRRDAWNWLVDQHWRIMFIGLRDWEWVLITAISYKRATGAGVATAEYFHQTSIDLAAACILLRRYPG
jgi:hypothetical protein